MHWHSTVRNRQFIVQYNYKNMNFKPDFRGHTYSALFGLRWQRKDFLLHFVYARRTPLNEEFSANYLQV